MGVRAGSGGLVRPGALKKDDPYDRGLRGPPEWPEGRETSGSDPCNPSGYSAMPFELPGGGFGNPRALSHSGLQASRKPHKAPRDRKLTGWCASPRVPVVRAGWRPAPWPLAYPHLILDGLTAVLLHKWSQHEGRRWGAGITARNPSRHSLLPGLPGTSVDYEG